jgi:mono/diheme cytochrome c family protein
MIMRLIGCLCICVFALGALAADMAGGNSGRGERLFQTQQCIRCHSINGIGGSTAPDLGRRIGRNQTPEVLATILWNHAPAMWSEMGRQGATVPALSAQDAANLFAFFYSARFFDKPGDAGRGREAFSRHRCSECHGLAQPKAGNAPAVATWNSLGSPLALAEAMWNHAEGMREEFAKRGFRWPQLTSQELTDVLVYLQNHPSIPQRPVSFDVNSGGRAEALLQEKGCLNCHQGALAPRLRGKTINDIAVAMWNHGPKMLQAVGTFQPGEMREVLSYVWEKQLFASTGDISRGKKVFGEKSCARCHDQGPGPRLTGQFNVVRMTSALWSHGPAMLKQMQDQGVQWPRFNARDMANLMAYLNSTR